MAPILALRERLLLERDWLLWGEEGEITEVVLVELQ
jgi:hypothetical protein